MLDPLIAYLHRINLDDYDKRDRDKDEGKKGSICRDRMPTRLPGLTGANGIRLPIRGGKQGGTRVPGLRVFSSLGSSEEVRLGLNTFQPTRRSLEASQVVSHSTLNELRRLR